MHHVFQLRFFLILEVLSFKDDRFARSNSKDHRNLILDPWYGDQEFGRVMAVTRKLSNFDEDANDMLNPCDSRGSRRQVSNSCEERIDTFTVGAADWLVHHFDLNKNCDFCELPDSASSALHASSSHDSDDFDHGACSNRHDQHDRLFQTSSSDSTQSWSQMPNQS